MEKGQSEQLDHQEWANHAGAGVRVEWVHEGLTEREQGTGWNQGDEDSRGMEYGQSQ